MSRIGRYAKAKAKGGQGDALAEKLLRAARQVERSPGCELYVVNRTPGDPDTIWVTEVWRIQSDIDAALQAEETRALIAEARPLIEEMELIETAPVGGVGLIHAAADVPPYTVVSLAEVEDAAALHGFGATGSVRFASEALEARATGVSHHRLNPGARQPFGHRHERAEEVYVMLAGSGRVRLDEDVVELVQGDAVRVAPPVARAFEASSDGLEFLAFGPRSPGDGEIFMGWWGTAA